jgi:DNA mismatch endonuclease (patch repair protein)
VLPKYRTAVFVHGCFWHRHSHCKIAHTPKSNTDFWITKFNRNVARDSKNIDQLAERGWRVLVVWECELNSVEKVQIEASRLAHLIKNT